MNPCLSSIIISNIASKGLLPLHVHVLCTQTFPKDNYEIILPIYEPIPNEEKIILKQFESEFPHFIMLDLLSEKRSGALNRAAEKSKGKWLIFVESHCIMPRNWLQNYMLFLEQGKKNYVIGEIEDLPSNSVVSQMESLIKKQKKQLATDYNIHHTAILRELFFKEKGFLENIPVLAEFDLAARVHSRNIPVERFTTTVLHKNDTNLAQFLRIVSGNGRDQMRIIKLRGDAFSGRYFYSPFIKLWRILKPFHLFFLMSAYLLIFLARLGYNISLLLRNQEWVYYFFCMMAKNSHRLGFIKSLGERECF